MQGRSLAKAVQLCTPLPTSELRSLLRTATIVSCCYRSRFRYLFTVSSHKLLSQKVRYRQDHLDIERTGAIVAPQYQYSTALNAQQPPLLDTPSDFPSSSAQHVSFSGYYTVAHLPRNQIPHDLPVQPISNSRHPSMHGDGSLDLRYSSTSERRLPGDPSHDQFYSKQARTTSALQMDGDHEPPMSSSSEHGELSTNATVASSSRGPRREVSTVVIACRQWYALFCLHYVLSLSLITEY